MRSSIIDPLPWFSVANLKFVYTDYKHDELDNNKVGATFKTNECRFAHRAACTNLSA